MLVLSRKVGERLLIGDKIVVTVVRIGQGGVRIGIEAPADLAVVREELATRESVAAGVAPSSSGVLGLRDGQGDEPPRKVLPR